MPPPLAGVNVRFGVDATQLLATTPTTDWQQVRHLVWNFPLASAAEATSVPFSPTMLLGEGDEANKLLMAGFCKSVARLMLCCNPDLKVRHAAQQSTERRSVGAVIVAQLI